jgi:hypothetical protein
MSIWGSLNSKHVHCRFWYLRHNIGCLFLGSDEVITMAMNVDQARHRLEYLFLF